MASTQLTASLLLAVWCLTAVQAVPRGYTAGRGRQLDNAAGNGGPPMPYNFEWQVDDQEYENYYGQTESAGDTGRVEGSYYVWLPDQRLMRVDYYVDGESGFVPTITYEDAYTPNWGSRPYRK